MVFNLISNILNLALFLFSCNIFLTPKKNKHHPIACICTVALLTMINTITGNQFNLICMTILYSLFVIFYYRDAFLFKLSIVLIFIICLSACELISLEILTHFYGTYFLSNSTMLPYLIGVICSNALMLIFLILIKPIYLLYKSSFLPRYTCLFIILPLTTIFMVLGIKDYYRISIYSKGYIFIIIGLLLSNLVSLYIFYKVIDSINKQMALKENVLIEKNKNATINDLLNMNNKSLHGIRSQTLKMLKLLAAKDYTQLQFYILDIFKSTTKIYNMINSNYKGIDAIINNNLNTLINNGIDVRVKLLVTEFPQYDENFIMNILSLMLNIAIKETEFSNSSSKNIFIDSKSINDNILLKIKFNSVDRTKEINVLPIYVELWSIFKENKLVISYQYDEKFKMGAVNVLLNICEDVRESD